MKDEKKTLVPEVLPAPAAISSRSPRERVTRHLDQLRRFGIVAGAAALANCGYMVVDPLPPPAQCQALGNFTAEASAWRENGTVRVEVRISFSQPGGQTLTFGELTLGEGTLVSEDRADLWDSFILTVEATPDGTSNRLRLGFRADCTEPGGTSSANDVLVTVFLYGPDGGVDGGAGADPDGGVDAGAGPQPLDTMVEIY